jgi:hypothetical protein
MSVHSIVVQSPLLKKLLQKVLRDYPGLAVNLRRLELTGKFEPIIHRWARLQEEIEKLDDATEEDRETKKHAELLFGVLKEEFKDLIESSQDMMSKGVMYEPQDMDRCIYVVYTSTTWLCIKLLLRW